MKPFGNHGGLILETLGEAFTAAACYDHAADVMNANADPSEDLLRQLATLTRDRAEQAAAQRGQAPAYDNPTEFPTRLEQAYLADLTRIALRACSTNHPDADVRLAAQDMCADYDNAVLAGIVADNTDDQAQDG